MEQHYRISIIVPVYKVEKYISRCIESIISQDMDNVFMECLLIDDCSPDKSITIAKEKIKLYSGNIIFRIITHEHNKGLSAARNTGINAAQGDFILFIDSDDYMKPNSISKMIEALEKNPKADSIIANYYDCKEEKVPFPIKEIEIATNTDDIMKFYYDIKIKNAAWNKLVSREHILKHHIYFVEGLLNEDVLWSYRQYSTSNYIVIIPDVTYVYEFNPLSIVNTTSEKAEKNIESFLYISDKLLDEPYQGHYVDFILFTFNYIVKALYLMQTYKKTEIQKYKFRKVRTKILTKSLLNHRYIISIFFLLLFWPISLLLKLSFYRNIYDKQFKLVALLAKTFNCIHKSTT
jgi:glycosyltransferase involved in cell wall biosynthesis